MKKFGFGIREWKKFGSGIRDGKISDPGSETNIPDPQHCSIVQTVCVSSCFLTSANLITVLHVLCICPSISEPVFNFFMFLTTALAVPVPSNCQSFSWNLTFLFLYLVLPDSNDQHNLLLFLTFALSHLTVL
jgi:hypothetical protein